MKKHVARNPGDRCLIPRPHYVNQFTSTWGVTASTVLLMHAAARIAQAEFDGNYPNVVIGSPPGVGNPLA